MKNERGPRDGDGDYHKRRDFNGGHDDRRAARYRRLANAVPDAPPRLIVSNERVRDPRIRPHWFFDNMVVREENNPKDGESVYLQDTRGRFVGSAIYNSRSRIRARLFSLDHVAWDAAYVRSAVEAAVRRRDAFFEKGDSMRLIYADADFLPGVVADRLGDVIVIQLLTMSADRMADVIVEELKRLLDPSGFVLQLGSSLREKEGLPVLPNNVIGDVPPRVWVPQDGFGLYADVIAGQKTRLFLDQRFNRRLLEPWCRDKNVLDLFCHVGGWSMAALKYGAAHVTGVDSSASAPVMAKESLERNGFAAGSADFVEEDVFTFLDGAADANKTWDVIVTDPPAFAKNAHVLDSALRGYLSLNYRAMKQLAPDGVLVACSCSQAVSAAAFDECLELAARNARMHFHVVARGVQAPDHPALLGFEESRYLKCVVLRRVQ